MSAQNGHSSYKIILDGETVAQVGDDLSPASQQGYTGHVGDNTGLVYMQARYYDPAIGRFYSNDPVGFIGPVDTFNRYSYVANNPYKYTDPSGMTKKEDRDNRNYQRCEEDPNCTNVIKRQYSTPQQSNGERSSSSSVPPLLQMALKDSGVSSSLSQAWQDSNPDAPSVLRGHSGSLKLEQGGWIVGSLGKFKVIRVAAGTRDSLATIQGTRPSGVVVGWFHTHPNTVAEGYAPTSPSAGDIGFTRQEAKVPGVVIHHNGMFLIPYPLGGL